GVGVNRFLYPFPDAPLILADNYAGGAQVEITPENQSEAIKRAIDYTTVISLYSIGLCGEAIPLSKQITAELDKEFGKFYYIDDTWVSLLFLQANCAIAAQDFDKAIQLLVQSQRRSDYWEITPSWLRVNYYLAWVYLQVGREDDALNLIRNIVEETSHIPGSGDDYNDALLNSARLYALMSRYDD